MCSTIIVTFDDSSDPFKTENGHHSIYLPARENELPDDVCSPSKPIKTYDRKFVRGMHIMLFPQKGILLLKDPNELGCDNKHDKNRWVNLSVINVFIEYFLQYPDEPT